MGETGTLQPQTKGHMMVNLVKFTMLVVTMKKKIFILSN